MHYDGQRVLSQKSVEMVILVVINVMAKQFYHHTAIELAIESINIECIPCSGFPSENLQTYN